MATATVPASYVLQAGIQQVTVLNPGGSITSQTQFLPFTVTASVTITTSATLPPGTVGSSYSVSLQASGGSLPYLWTSPSGTPAFLTLTTDGTLSTLPGTTLPTAGQFSFTIQVADSSSPPLMASQTFSLSVSQSGGGLTITTSSPLPAATVGTAYTVTLAASGGNQPYIWSALSSLPPGLTLSGGVISGTPTTASQYSLRIQVADSSTPQLTAQQTFSVTVSSQGGTLSITTSSLPGATAGQAYTATLTASGGTPPYTWSGTSVPAGLALNQSSGVLSGTAPSSGTFSITIQVTDSASHTSSKSLSLVVSSGSSPPLTITTCATLPQGMIGTAYSFSLDASGGNPPYNFSVLSPLPPGLMLSGGVISGTPTTASQYSFRIQVADSSSPQLTSSPQTFSLTITGASGGPLTISPCPLPAGIAGQPYDAMLAAYGGTPPYTWLAGTSIPSWLSIDPVAGVLGGTPPTIGTYTVPVQVTDSSSPTPQTVSKSYSLSVTANPLSITTGSTLPAGMVGVAYTPIVFSATGGAGPYTFAVLSGNTDGLVFGSDNVTFSGTPTTAGTFSFVVQVADSTGLQNMSTFSLTVTGQAVSPLTISTSSLPGATAGQAYTATLAASGGTPPYMWLAAPGTQLPTWLTLNSTTGMLSGTPTAGGTITVSVQVTDSTSPVKTATRTFSLAVTAPTLSITTSSTLPAGMVGAAYPKTTFVVSGGVAPYAWVVLSGNEDGLSLDGTGVLTGTPLAAGAFSFSLQVTDSSSTPLTTTKTFMLTVTAPPLTITTAGSSSAAVGVAFSQSYTVAGGTPPYTWSVTNGSVPGLTLSPTTPTSSPAMLSGTPTTQGTFTITLKVTDANQAIGTRSFSITVAAAPAPPRITSANQLPAGTLGASYSFQMAATGGTPPYTWTATGLPSGLTINSAGVISGTLGAAGNLTFVVTVTDSAQPPATARNNFTINVSPPALPAITISGLPSAAAALMQYSVTVAVASSYPVSITGTATLSSSPADNGPTDGSIQFSGGGKSASFTINAGTTSTTLAIQTGSVAGTITLTLSPLSAGGMDVTPTPAPSAKTQMAGAAPVITGTSVSRSGSTLTVQITGYATSRELTQAVFTFTAASGQSLQTGAASITVQLSSLFSTYFQNSQYASFGSQFVFSQPFTIQGDISSVIPQNVTLTNRVGSTTSPKLQ